MNKSTDFINKIKNNPLPVIVDVWAPWCMPCKMLEPTLEKLHKVYEGKIDIWKLNADEYPEISKTLNVRAIPTLVGFNNGEEIARSIGNKNYKSLTQFFDGVITGEEVETTGLNMTDRILRSIAGIALFVIARWGGNSIILYIIGAVVLFSAFYDRCPLWKAVTAQIKKLFQPKETES
jgi:thioredoxin 1